METQDIAGMPPLEGAYRVLDLSAGIAGAYCTKVLADGGAEVVMVEPPEGNALRRHSASGQAIDLALGGVLFQFLSCSKASVVADLSRPADLALVQKLAIGSDAIVWSSNSPLCGHPALSPEALRKLAPHATIVAISPFGLESPWRDRPGNEFVLQAMCGNAWSRGPSDGPPYMTGGSHADFAAGTGGALAALLSRMRALRTGEGELVDLAALDVLHLTHYMFGPTFFDMTKRPHRVKRSHNIPTAHQARDGWVGLWVTTGQQWLDFCTMLGREDWYADPSLGLMDNRALRFDELIEAMDAWVAERTVDEIVELAQAMRVPVSPIANGATMPAMDHYVERGFFTANPRTGVTQPTPWYRFSNGAAPRPPGASPLLGADTERYRAADLMPLLPRPDPAAAAAVDVDLPLADLRIADMTAFWAGPIISHAFAFLGADVIHVESQRRPDGIRMAAVRPMSEEGWWETSAFFNGINTNKRAIALDLQTKAGYEAFLRLVRESDVLVENYSPRVMGQLGLDYEKLREVRPDVIMVRAPGYGISGPWTERVAYAPTIDYASGLAWVCGPADGRPSTLGSPSDALGGWHGSIAILLALEYRRRTGRGMLLESAQVGGAVNFACEQVLEHSAHGVLLSRTGNRSWTLAPQGVYRTLDADRSDLGLANDDWVAISIESDEQWSALCRVLGEGALESDPELEHVEGRRRNHDRIDEAIAAWCATRSSEEAESLLTTGGVPASRVWWPHDLAEQESARARGLYEVVDHPVAGRMRVPGFPIRMEHRPSRWTRSPAPCFGEHNYAVLHDLLGYSDTEIDKLTDDKVIGDRVLVNLGW